MGAETSVLYLRVWLFLIRPAMVGRLAQGMAELAGTDWLGAGGWRSQQKGRFNDLPASQMVMLEPIWPLKRVAQQKSGMNIYVTGHFGDAAAAGADLSRWSCKVSSERFGLFLIVYCGGPKPRLLWVWRWSGVVHAMMEISDGLAFKISKAQYTNKLRWSGATIRMRLAWPNVRWVKAMEPESALIISVNRRWWLWTVFYRPKRTKRPRLHWLLKRLVALLPKSVRIVEKWFCEFNLWWWRITGWQHFTYFIFNLTNLGNGFNGDSAPASVWR